MDTAKLSKAYIYIIYPSNYNKDDFKTRQFYIGSTYDNINKTRDKFYNDFYKGTIEKKIILMRKYMTSDEIKIDNDQAEDKKLWQFRILFIGHNCCSITELKLLEGLYIYYYYSILNDETITFKPLNITDKDKQFFDKIGIYEHLCKCYNPFTYEDLIYDVNPYTLIDNKNQGATLKQYEHIYKEICERKFIPIFEDIFHLTFQYFYDEPEPEPEPKKLDLYPCYEAGPIDRPYKCKWCDKTYIGYNRNLYEHLITKHKEMYDDTLDNFKKEKPK